MTTREVIEKMPTSIITTLEEIRRDYKNPSLNRDNTRKYLYGYTKGLRDSGLITEWERRVLYAYGTV